MTNQEDMTKEVKNSNMGRPKGSPNKRTADLFDIAEKHNCNPFEILIMFAKGDFEGLGLPEKKLTYVGKGDNLQVNEDLTISPELREKSAKDACEYLFPKRKAIEHTGLDGADIFAKFINEINGKSEQ